MVQGSKLVDFLRRRPKDVGPDGLSQKKEEFANFGKLEVSWLFFRGSLKSGKNAIYRFPTERHCRAHIKKNCLTKTIIRSQLPCLHNQFQRVAWEGTSSQGQVRSWHPSRKESQALHCRSGSMAMASMVPWNRQQSLSPTASWGSSGHPWLPRHLHWVLSACPLLSWLAWLPCFDTWAGTCCREHTGATVWSCTVYPPAIQSNPGKERILLWVKSWVSVLYLSDHAKRSHANNALNSVIIFWLSLSRQPPTNLPQASQRKLASS